MEKLAFQNVRQSATDEDRMFIYFMIEGYWYFLFVLQNEEGVFVPKQIVHYTNEMCPLCQNPHKYLQNCSALHEHKDELFQRLIEHPSIRLEWLFLNHVSEHKE